MNFDATITRVVARPNGALLHLDAHPHKLGVVGPGPVPEVGQQVSGDDARVQIWSSNAGEGGEIACYRREGLRLYAMTPGADDGETPAGI